jgi:catechol 2,3-dioxygenase-like lactoylglutathione lyase family enzyme
MRVSAATLSSPDANALAGFYARLLGWPVVDEDQGWVRIRPPSGGAGLSFHHEDHYAAPVWPAAPGRQLMMVHLDIAVEDLDAGVSWALDAGATLAEHQPQPDVRVMLDPDGHPFCLFQGSPRGEFDAVDWNGVETAPASGGS